MLVMLVTQMIPILQAPNDLSQHAGAECNQQFETVPRRQS